MKNRTAVSIFFGASLLIFGCNYDVHNVADENVINIQKDESFVELQASINSREEKIIDQTYDFSGVDLVKIKNGLKDCRTEQDYVELYTSAGMKNPVNYLNSIKHHVSSINSLAKRYPEIQKMDLDTRRKLLSPLSKSDTVRFKYLMAQRMNKLSSNKQK